MPRRRGWVGYCDLPVVVPLMDRNPLSYLRTGAIGSAIRAAAARQRLDSLNLFARLFIDGGVAEVDVPVQARMRVVLLFGGWVRWVRGRLIHVNLLSRLAGPPGD